MIRKVLYLASYVTIASAISQLLMLGFSPVLTRLFTPEEFGYFAVFSSLVVAFGAISTGRFELAMLSETKLTQKNNLLFIALVSCVLFTVFLAILFFSLNKIVDQVSWSNFSNESQSLLFLGVILVGFQQCFTHLAVREKNYKVVAFSKLLNTIIFLASTLLINHMFIVGPNLIEGYLLGIFSSILIFFAFRKTMRFNLDEINFEDLKALIQRKKSYPLIVSVSDFMSNLGFILPPVIIAFCFGADKAGLFALSQRLLGAPLAFLGHSLGQVYLGEGAHLLHKSEFEFRKFFKEMMRLLVLLAFFILIPIGVVCSKLAATLFGPDWLEIGPLVLTLLPMFILQFLASPLSNTLILLGKEKLLLIFDVARLFSLISWALIAHRSEVDFAIFIWGLVFLNVIYYISISIAPYFTFRGCGKSS